MEDAILRKSDEAAKLCNQGRYEEALQAFEVTANDSILSLGPTHRISLLLQNNIGRVLCLGNHLEEALKIFKDTEYKMSVRVDCDKDILISVKYNIASILEQQCKFDEALNIFKEVYSVSVKTLGPDDNLTLLTWSSIASILSKQGKCNEALDIYKKNCTKRECTEEIEDDAVLIAKTGIANLLAYTCKYEDALKIYREVYHLYETKKLPNHKILVEKTINIAHMLCELGEQNKALDMLNDFYQKQEKTESDQSSVLSVRHCIAFVLIKQRKFKETLEILREVYNKRKELFGIEHPDTLDAGNDLGYVLTELNYHEEAFHLLKEVLNKRAEILGKKNIRTLDTQHNFAALLAVSGNHVEALRLYKLIRAIRQEVCPHSPDHLQPQIYLQTQINLAKELEILGKYKEALQILNEVLHLQKSRPLRSTTLEACYRIAGVLYKLENYEEALKLSENVDKNWREIMGVVHPDRTDTQMLIGLILYKQRKFKESLDIFKEIEERLDRTEESDSAKKFEKGLYVKNNIALVYLEEKEYNRALEIFKKVSDEIFFEKMLGPLHSDVLTLRNSLAITYTYLEQYDTALPIFYDVYRKRVKSLGTEHPDTIATLKSIENVKSRMPESNLYAAVSESDLMKVEFCIDTGDGIAINKTDTNGCTLLHKASEIGNSEIMKLLLKNGAFYNIKNNIHKTPLHLASSEAAKELLNLVESIFRSVKSGRYETIRKFKNNSIIINAKDDTGNTPLHWACNAANKSIVEMLLNKGADPTLVNVEGNSPLHIATSEGYVEIVKILIKHVEANNPLELHYFINAKTSDKGTTALHVAAERGYLETVKLLLENGVNFDAENTDGKKPLDLAEKKEIIDLFSSF